MVDLSPRLKLNITSITGNYQTINSRTHTKLMYAHDSGGVESCLLGKEA